MRKLYFLILPFFLIIHATAKADIVVSNWDGYSPSDIMDTFEGATGISGEMAFHATNEEIMGKVVASKGAGYDVLFVSSPFAEALHKLGLLSYIDHNKIPNLKNLDNWAMNLDYDMGNQFQVPYAWGTTGICYRSDLVSKEPTSWNDLLNPSSDMVGKVTMLSTDRWLLAAGQLLAGYSVNDTNPEHMANVADILKSAKGNLLSYDDTTFYSKLVSGEAVMAHAWDGWCNYAIWENPDVKFMIPEEGSDLWVDTMVILKSSDNKDEAHAFINYILDEDIGSWTIENILYKTPNKAAMDKTIPGLVEAFPNMGMTPQYMMSFETLKDVGDAAKLYATTVSDILAD